MRSLWACCSLLLSARLACADWNNRLLSQARWLQDGSPLTHLWPCRPVLACVQPARMHGECLHHTEGSWKFGRTVLQTQSNTSKGLSGVYQEYYQAPSLNTVSCTGGFHTSVIACSGVALLLNMWSFVMERVSALDASETLLTWGKQKERGSKIVFRLFVVLTHCDYVPGLCRIWSWWGLPFSEHC